MRCGSPRRAKVAGVVLVTFLSACQASSTQPAASPRTAAHSSSKQALPTPPAPTHTRRRHHGPRPTPSATPSTSARSTHQALPPQRQPVIVVDPGHSPTIHAIDRRTGLDVSDYENEPEMRDVFAVAKLVKRMLTAAGYRVILTKKNVRALTSLGRRADVANRVHADLALSIHDQAGSNGGLPFRSANNVVYYQSVGTYRETPSGKKVYFTDRHVAALSKRYGRIFGAERRQVEHENVAVQGNVGYNLGSRGLPAGNIWVVQLLARVPWIYNESGGNSTGRSGLDHADKLTYAKGLVASVEHCIRPPR